MNNKLLIGVIISVVLFNSLFFYFKWRSFKKKFDALKIPPWISKCPDYWTMEKEGVCRNVNNLGTCAKDSTIDFNNEQFKGRDGDLNKCRFAQNCNISWTGIDKLCK